MRVIDVIVSWDAADSTVNAGFDSKVDKYRKLVDNFPGKSFSVGACALGARGLVTRKAASFLVQSGLSKADICFLSASALRGSLIVLGRFMNL